MSDRDNPYRWRDGKPFEPIVHYEYPPKTDGSAFDAARAAYLPGPKDPPEPVVIPGLLAAVLAEPMPVLELPRIPEVKP